jgi:hypothetical protein
MDKRILHLTVRKKWFDEIACGKKKEEYREIKPYWTVRLKNKAYDEIWFKNGYGDTVPFMRVECLGSIEREGKYVILLGEILEIKKYN